MIDQDLDSVIKTIEDAGKDKVKITAGETDFTLSCKKLAPSVILGWEVTDKITLLEFWNVIKDVYSKYREKDNENKSLHTLNGDKQSTETCDDDVDNNYNNDVNDQLTNEDDSNLDDRNLDQSSSFDKIQSKSVGKFYLDIFNLKDPPDEFTVRKRHEDFVEKIAELMIEKIAELMIEKRGISIENAVNVLALIKVDKYQFKEEMLEKCPIYVIDGNHNIRAQKLAFERTKDWVFRFRMVHIYCNLIAEEALLLGTSRNEDSSTVLKFSDFDKVSLVRRYLYSSSQVEPDTEPPEPTKGFSVVYKQLLGLKTKKEVDCKAVIRFLATKLSRRCFALYSDICRHTFIKASRFDCLRGLEDEKMYIELFHLKRSDRRRLDWKMFKDNCMNYRNKLKKQQRSIQISFNKNGTSADLTSHRGILSDCVCFTCVSPDGQHIKSLSAKEMEQLVFASSTPLTVKPSKVAHNVDEQRDMTLTLSPSKLGPHIIKRHFIELERGSNVCSSNDEENSLDNGLAEDSLNYSRIERSAINMFSTSTPLKQFTTSLSRNDSDDLNESTSEEESSNGTGDIDESNKKKVSRNDSDDLNESTSEEESSNGSCDIDESNQEKDKSSIYSFTSNEASPIKTLNYERLGQTGQASNMEITKKMKKGHVRLTDIGTVKNLKGYVNNACKKAKLL